MRCSSSPTSPIGCFPSPLPSSPGCVPDVAARSFDCSVGIRLPWRVVVCFHVVQYLPGATRQGWSDDWESRAGRIRLLFSLQSVNRWASTRWAAGHEAGHRRARPTVACLRASRARARASSREQCAPSRTKRPTRGVTRRTVRVTSTNHRRGDVRTANSKSISNSAWSSKVSTIFVCALDYRMLLYVGVSSIERGSSLRFLAQSHDRFFPCKVTWARAGTFFLRRRLTSSQSLLASGVFWNACSQQKERNVRTERERDWERETAALSAFKEMPERGSGC